MTASPCFSPIMPGVFWAASLPDSRLWRALRSSPLVHSFAPAHHRPLRRGNRDRHQGPSRFLRGHPRRAGGRSDDGAGAGGSGPRPSGANWLAGKPPYQLDMIRIKKLIHRRYFARVQNPPLPGSRHHGQNWTDRRTHRRYAGLCGGQLLYLRFRARAGRIQHRGVKAIELLHRQRDFEQITLFRCDRFQALCLSGRFPQQPPAPPFLLDSMDFCAPRQW